MMPVYFVQAGEDGPIKIGFTSNIARRMSAFQVMSPARLRPLAHIEGGKETEQSLHHRFRQQRIVGEWFGPTEELLALVATGEPIVARVRRPMVVPPMLDILPADMTIPQLLESARICLLHDIAGFIAERNITETTFGRLAVNDGKFVARLRSTGNMTTALIAKAHDFICAERSKAEAA